MQLHIKNMYIQSNFYIFKKKKIGYGSIRQCHICVSSWHQSRAKICGKKKYIQSHFLYLKKIDNITKKNWHRESKSIVTEPVTGASM